MTENDHERHNRLQKARANWPQESEPRWLFMDWMVVLYLLAIGALMVAALFFLTH